MRIFFRRKKFSWVPVKAVFHEPHLEKETDKGVVKSVRDFLIGAGIEPQIFESETFVNDDE